MWRCKGWGMCFDIPFVIDEISGKGRHCLSSPQFTLTNLPSTAIWVKFFVTNILMRKIELKKHIIHLKNLLRGLMI